MMVQLKYSPSCRDPELFIAQIKIAKKEVFAGTKGPKNIAVQKEHFGVYLIICKRSVLGSSVQ